MRKLTVPHIPYTKEEDEIILQRRREFVSHADIATELGRASDSSVRRRFWTLVKSGAPGALQTRNPLSEMDFETIVKRRTAGVQWQEIAKSYDRTTLSMANAYREYKQAKLYPHLQNIPRRPWTDEEISYLIDCRESGQTFPNIADSLHRSVNSVKSKFTTIKMSGNPSRPTIVNAFTKEDDDSIIYLREILDLSWPQIGQKMPNRKNSAEPRYYNYLRPKESASSNSSTKRFTPRNFALLHDLCNQQQLSWEAVQEKMPQFTVQELQYRHTFLSRWPPPSTLPLAAVKQSRNFTTVTESSMRFFGKSCRTLLASPRPGTLWTTPTIHLRGHFRSFHALYAPSCRLSARDLPPERSGSFVDISSRCRSADSFPSLHSIARFSSRKATTAVPKRGASKAYSDEDFELIAKRRQEGATYKELAVELGRSCHNAVARAFNRWVAKTGHNTPLPRSRTRNYSKVEVDLVIRRRQEGKSFPEIAMEIGRSSMGLASLWQRWTAKTGQEHLRRRNRRRGDDCDYEYKLIKKMRSSGVPWLKIAAELGRDPTGVARTYRFKEQSLALGAVMCDALRDCRPFSIADLQILKHSRDVLRQSWPEIAQHMGRKPSTLQSTYYRDRLKNTVNRPSSFKADYSQEQLQMLEHLRSVLKLPWKEIQLRMPNRTITALQERHRKITAEADVVLRAAKSSDESDPSPLSQKS